MQELEFLLLLHCLSAHHYDHKGNFLISTKLLYKNSYKIININDKEYIDHQDYLSN